MIEQLKEAEEMAEDRWRAYKSQFRKVLQMSKAPIVSYLAYHFSLTHSNTAWQKH